VRERTVATFHVTAAAAPAAPGAPAAPAAPATKPARIWHGLATGSTGS
jgi:hypothetical protein